MRVIRKILYVILMLAALFSVLIIICAFNPDITGKIGDALYPDRDISADSSPDNDPGAAEAVNLPLAAGSSSEDTDTGNDSMENSNPSSIVSRTGTARSGDSQSNGLRDDNTTDYIVPNESEIAVPEDVAGRNGYRQVEADAEQVDDAAVDEIQNRLDMGYTGDGLTFDPLYYPYYAMLDDRGRHVYRQIYANADAVYPAFMPVEEVTAAQLRNVFSAVYNDHPELFWLETAFSYKFVSTGICVEIDLKFNRTVQDLGSAKTAFNDQTDDIVAGAQNLPDNYAKEKYVHDRLLDKISYSRGAELNQSAYSALVNGQTVCAGYSRAFQHILMQLGIPCYYCTGYAGESHAWNIVMLSDGFYNVDTTWDDTGGRSYEYFNKTDEDYATTHVRKELSVYLPPCSGLSYRNLEQSIAPDEDDNNTQNTQNELRSLADTGVSQDRVFSDIGLYYEDCYNQVVQNGIGSYTFYSVVTNQQMKDVLYQEYSDRTCWDKYLENATNAVDATYCRWQITAEELQDGMYLITHEIKMTK